MRPIFPSLYLVRHGETAWSITGQATGRADIPLTERGERDARRLAAPLSALKTAAVFTSPLQRARHTAELAGFAEAVPDADLVEWDYGTDEGRRTLDVRAERPNWRLFDDGSPGGESAAAVGARADRVIARARACNGDVLIFAHRDILRVLAARWIGLSPADGRGFLLGTSSISRLGYDHDMQEPVVHVWNDTAHLREPVSPAAEAGAH